MNFSQAPLETGNIISLWHGNRGHLYVVAGLNRGRKTLSLIKHNCINNSGHVHASTQRFHLEIPVDDFLEGTKVATKINRVYGLKEINKPALQDFVRNRVGSRTTVALTADHEIYPPIDVTADHRAAVSYT